MPVQKSLFDWQDSIVYLASGRKLDKHNWIGDVILYTCPEDQDYLVPVDLFKTWHESNNPARLPMGTRRLVDVIEQGCCFRIYGRVSEGVPF